MKVWIATALIVMAFLGGIGITTWHYKEYRLVNQTNIGGVVIDGRHVYELVELSDPAQGVVRK